MFSRFKQMWKENGFEIVLGSCIVFIVIFSLYRKITGKKGTWSRPNWSRPNWSRPRFDPTIYYNKSNRQPPKESKGEKECRSVLQSIFKRNFNKARPDFLKNPVTGGNFNLEIDCFDPYLKIGVEYNGIQHYKFVPYFHKNKEAFLNQKYRDDMKRRICHQHGILLIEVPYTVKIEDIRGYIEMELTKNGVKNIYTK